MSCISGDTKSAWSPSVEAAALVVCWIGPSLLQQQVSVAASVPLGVHTLLVLLVVSIFLLHWLSLVTFFPCEIGDGEVGDVGGTDGGGEEDPSSGGRAHCRRK